MDRDTSVHTSRAEDFDRRRWLRALFAGALVMLTGGVLTAVGSRLIESLYPDRPKPPDMLMDLLPHATWTQYAVEAIYIAGLALLVVYVISRHHVREIPEMAALYGLMDIFRAFVMVLTPLAAPYEEATHFSPAGGLIRQWGEIPSGHIATMLLFYLLIDAADAPRIKKALLALLVAETLVLPTSHSHYSVDIVAGLLLGYWVYHEYHHGKLFNWLKPFVKV